MEYHASTPISSTSASSRTAPAKDERIIAPENFLVEAPNRYQQTLEKPDILSTLASSNANVNESARLFTNPFDETSMAINGDNPLYKSLPGRLLTQTVSRGIFAAAMFTAGSYMVKKWNPGAGYGKDDQPLLGRPLEALSDMFDIVLTKPAEFILQHGFRMDEEAVKQLMTFNQYAAKPHMVEMAVQQASEGGVSELLNREVFGNTWGEEIVLRTFNFAAGSIGASIGRNVVAVLDPNHHTKWLKDGKIDWQELAKSTGESAFRIMSYNQMEDWFAAPFYTIQLRLMRGLFDQGAFGTNAPDAAMWDLQDGSNGTARFFTENGQLGDPLHGTGAIDFQSRFMLYNFYTLVFRDLYNHVGHMMDTHQEHNEHDVKSASTNPVGDFITGIGENTKYLLKSLIKSQIYMAPSVLVFWPQNLAMMESNHCLIDEKTGDFMTKEPSRPYDPKGNWNEPFIQEGKQSANSTIAARANDIRAGNELFRPGEETGETLHRPFYNVFFENDHPIDNILNPVGRFGTAYSGCLKEHITSKVVGIADHFLEGKKADAFAQDATWATDTFARAQLAYLPYMTAKYELAQLWDTPEMDASIYRMLDGITNFNGSEIIAGLKDIGNVIVHKEISEETKSAVGTPRGPVNSRAESEQHAEEAQARLRREHYYEKRHACAGDSACLEEVEQKEIAANNIVPYLRSTPDSQVANAEYNGKTKEQQVGQLILN